MAEQKRRTRARRGRGEGSIFRRESDGRWVGRLTTGYDSDGKRIRRTVYGTTKREVQDKLDELRAKSRAGIVDARGWTVGAWVDHWLDAIAKPSIGESSFDNYEVHIRRHVRPSPLAPTRLEALTAPLVRSWHLWMAETGRGNATQRRAHRVLKQALKAAVADRLLPSNPMDHVKAPPKVRKPMNCLDADAAGRLLDETRADRLHAVFVLALYTGMRQGEILALQWGNVDFAESRLRVEHNLVDRKGTVTLGPPKNEASRRTIILSEPVVEALRERQALAMREGHAGSPYVFTSPRGGPIQKSNFYRFTWEPIRDDHGLTVRFHDLRHTAATLMLQAGAPVKAVSEMLGHSSAAMTLDVYSHALDGMREQAAAAMTAALGTRKVQNAAETA